MFVPRPIGPNRRAEIPFPSEPLEIVRGRFDPQATEDVLEGCSECELPLLEKRNGIAFYGWGEDFGVLRDRVRRPPAIHQFGVGGRIAVLDDYVLRTIETAGMELLIDTQQGLRDSLAKNEEFKLLAEAMDSMGAYSIYLTDDRETWQVDNVLDKHEQVSKRDRERGSKGPLLHPYKALATGVGQDDQGLFMALTLVYDNPDDAIEDIPVLERRVQNTENIFRRPWTDYFSGIELRSDGRVLSGKLRTEKANMWSGIIDYRDLLFIYE